MTAFCEVLGDEIPVPFEVTVLGMPAQVTAVGHGRISFRRAFYVGFGSAVAAKLRDRVTEIAQQFKGTGAELVLQDRTARVQADYERRFPGIRPVRETGVDRDGWSSGRKAGQHADLGDRSVAILAIAELTT